MGAETLEQLLTVEQVAEMLQVSKTTVERLVRSGELKFSRVGRQLRFKPSQIQQYLGEHG